MEGQIVEGDRRPLMLAAYGDRGHSPAVLRRHERYAQVRERAVSGSRYCQRVGCPRLP